MIHAIYIPFFFIVGACVGSFLNVVVWRLPRGQSLVSPPSHCPKCNKLLAWYDNLPVIGWLKLRGHCRYCHEPISPRYPIVEAVTGALFVFYYVMFFMAQLGPCVLRPPGTSPFDDLLLLKRPLSIQQDWAIYGLYMFLVSSLLAASLIDAEMFIIPLEIPWLLAAVGLVVHAIIDTPRLPGALNANQSAGALAAGGGAGLLISMALWWLKYLPTSFPKGEPLLEVDREAMARELEEAKKAGRAVDEQELPPPYTRRQINAEIRKEMLFLLPPMLLAIAWWLLTWRVESLHRAWSSAMAHHWWSGLLGAVLGALVGGFVVWIFRIAGTLGFGRVAMGLGDVHLMFGVGAVIGAGAVTVAFFLAPFFGIVLAIYMLLSGTRRELPYGPYLSLATGFVLLFYCDIAGYLAPGLSGLVQMVQQLLGMAPQGF